MSPTTFKAREDELTYCNQRHLWAKHDEVIGRLNFLLLPHGHDYLSPLNALFLYHRQSLHHLSHFKNIFVRDGLLMLFKFFLSNRNPHFFKSNLIVHEDLARFVPQEWRGQVYFYRPIQAMPVRRKNHSPRKTLLLTGIIDHINAPVDKVQLCLDQLAIHKFERVKAFFRMPNPEGENQLWKLNQHYGQTLTRLMHQYPQIEFMTWEETRATSGHETYFLDLGQEKFWYADSYVSHFLHQRNALCPLMPQAGEASKALEKLMLSPYHGFEIHQNTSNEALEFSDHLFQEYDRAQPYAFQDEKDYPKENQPCSPELVTFLTTMMGHSF